MTTAAPCHHDNVARMMAGRDQDGFVKAHRQQLL